MLTESASLLPVLGLAAAAGLGHTLLGPDHYVPLAAVARSRGWSARRLGLAALAFGLLHCLMSVGLVLGFAGAATTLDWMASAAAWLMVGTGLCLALHFARRRRPSRAAPALLGAAFLIGPCEWLVPVAGATLASQGVSAALAVCGVFSAVTVGTMVAATAVSAFGLKLVPERHAALTGAFACVLCGGLMLVGF